MQQLSSLFDVLVAEGAFEFEFLQPEHPSDHCVDIEDVDCDEDQEQDGEDVVESFAEDWNYVSLAHHLRKGCIFISNDLQKIVAKWS